MLHRIKTILHRVFAGDGGTLSPAEEDYLAGSIDLADLERRQRELEKARSRVALNPAPYAFGG